MSKNKIYNSIVAMKHFFAGGFEVADPTTGEIVDIYDFMHEMSCESGLAIYDLCKFLRGKFKRLKTFTDKVAFLTVLSLGTFSDDDIYHTFYLPSTTDCMETYKKIEKKLKRKQRITINFSLGNNHMPSNPYDIMNYEITVDFFAAKPIMCKYWDTEGIQCIERY